MSAGNHSSPLTENENLMDTHLLDTAYNDSSKREPKPSKPTFYEVDSDEPNSDSDEPNSDSDEPDSDSDEPDSDSDKLNSDTSFKKTPKKENEPNNSDDHLDETLMDTSTEDAASHNLNKLEPKPSKPTFNEVDSGTSLKKSKEDEVKKSKEDEVHSDSDEVHSDSDELDSDTFFKKTQEKENEPNNSDDNLDETLMDISTEDAASHNLNKLEPKPSKPTFNEVDSGTSLKKSKEDEVYSDSDELDSDSDELDSDTFFKKTQEKENEPNNSMDTHIVDTAYDDLSKREPKPSEPESDSDTYLKETKKKDIQETKPNKSYDHSMNTSTKSTICHNVKSKKQITQEEEEALKKSIETLERLIHAHHKESLGHHHSIIEIQKVLEIIKTTSLRMINRLSNHVQFIVEQSEDITQSHKKFLLYIKAQFILHEETYNRANFFPQDKNHQKNTTINLEDISNIEPFALIEGKEFMTLPTKILSVETNKENKKHILKIENITVESHFSKDPLKVTNVSIITLHPNNMIVWSHPSYREHQDEIIDNHQKNIDYSYDVTSHNNNINFIKNSIDNVLLLIMINVDHVITLMDLANNNIKAHNTALTAAKTCIKTLNEKKSQLETLTTVKANSTINIDQPIKTEEVNTSLSTNDAKITLNNDHVEKTDIEPMEIDQHPTHQL